ncbi:glycosyltransferase family 1 protein (plasmid) [Streptomyces clavuligerus]|uniref:glycosyltransferase family 4 protein n=7 Tax=Streptomyces clavuligerus TaxID=1901 RepID=UPI0005D230F0|nr:glycosyltransferase family 1 protein [Streptomyces clavuligerus]MBY6307828.1 glycosyltransferase family 1 protein [Streptomyces clavuligerus]QCS10875.1 glycosyltransferase family 1 protein [Streptomyces clavuligerus]QPJ98529.1 glycosyltransferase [Streptomyces clavuligerus]WDN57579.1 glycosyltransferase family 1 protein [Streptomyces clavuligerus]
MRVVVVAESFAPQLNGVAHSVLRVAEHLRARGHVPLVVAPAPGATGGEGASPQGERPYGYEVVRVPSVPLPGYPEVRVALPGRRVADAIARHRPHVVHLAGPLALGAAGGAAAGRAGVPVVAVFQTDLAAYARTYLPVARAAGARLAWWWLRRVHTAAARTLAPSRASLDALRDQGVPRLHLWPRGVDCVRFHPRHRDEALRRRLGPGQVLVGYVGRLAVEKRVEHLAQVARIPGVRLVVVGDGPCRARLEAALPHAVFLGRRTGHDLARLYASFDVFAHAGPYETFGQTLQEAMASGLPVVAPAAGGPLDLVRPERTGFLVPPHDEGGLRQAVERLADSGALRTAFGRAGRADVVERSWEAVGDRLIDHYRRAIVETGGFAGP